MIRYLLLSILFHLYSTVKCNDHFKFTETQIKNFRADVKDMFYHAYNGYIQYAMPYDELRPLTCDGHDTWGSYSLTLIDALDTLAVMNNKSEFQRVYHIISERENFDADINVSVFETNIRIVGGLLSGHLFARRMGISVGPKWPCDGPLLRLAVDAAMRLLPAFDTPTGMPYGTVNLRYGVPKGETPITCTAGVGTFVVEFGTISRLTGDPLFEKVALNAMHYLWNTKSRLGLIGNHIDVLTGRWTEMDAGIGAGVDSFYEYLVKGAFLLQRPELMKMFLESREAIEKHLRYDDWYLWKSMNKGHVTMAVFQSLEAFWPGLLTLTGDIESAQRTMYNYHQILKQYGFHPEFYNIPESGAYTKRSGYPLRPEFVESLMYLYQATKDHQFLKMGADLLRSIEHSAKTECGYATIRDVNDHSLDNRMESFFLAETTKYLYLLFHDTHWLHSQGYSGRPHRVDGRSCIIEGGAYFFNTEAHPIDMSTFACCTGPEDDELLMSQENIVSLLVDPTKIPELDLDLSIPVVETNKLWHVFEEQVDDSDVQENESTNSVEDGSEHVSDYKLEEYDDLIDDTSVDFEDSSGEDNDSDVDSVNDNEIISENSSNFENINKNYVTQTDSVLDASNGNDIGKEKENTSKNKHDNLEIETSKPEGIPNESKGEAIKDDSNAIQEHDKKSKNIKVNNIQENNQESFAGNSLKNDPHSTISFGMEKEVDSQDISKDVKYDDFKLSSSRSRDVDPNNNYKHTPELIKTSLDDIEKIDSPLKYEKVINHADQNDLELVSKELPPNHQETNKNYRMDSTKTENIDKTQIPTVTSHEKVQTSESKNENNVLDTKDLDNDSKPQSKSKFFTILNEMHALLDTVKTKLRSAKVSLPEKLVEKLETLPKARKFNFDEFRKKVYESYNNSNVESGKEYYNLNCSIGFFDNFVYKGLIFDTKN